MEEIKKKCPECGYETKVVRAYKKAPGKKLIPHGLVRCCTYYNCEWKEVVEARQPKDK